ncbi:amidohydrolase [Halanaerobium saccharolyticum]|uniref:Peptidase M20 domain-containing protein 2 n=1 Tax=Halanaerobium saccharolyticum TaxID=43595 RepID=A0A4R7Z7F4_9FIRM|nr:amidohydrolase [Halanaerobium saccharolyticum]TDW06427.1 amidohydrolase [Halanaerobium saccharolyticum]TDX61675.1 amidohydrolase [Halanaerobium saccharolyticum]
MQKDEIKKKIIEVINDNRSKIIEIIEEIYKTPELGYKEEKTTSIIAKAFSDLEINFKEHENLTGINALLKMENPGPTIAVLGELDAVICTEHPDADPETKAVHACGHNIQLGVMYGVAAAFKKAGVESELAGTLNFIATPAEEFIELEFRDELRESGKINYFGGKQELIKRGSFDDVDISIMMHSLDLGQKKALIAPEGNGFVGKKIKFIGKESHAGSAPEKGINALNAAVLAMNNINAQRETFAEKDRVRVHPIITKGGDIVNIVPADVRMESYVRARNIEAIKSANKKVDRSLKAAAMAVGADVKITDIPGYLPLLNNEGLDLILKSNLLNLVEKEEITVGGDFTGSFDFGDVSHLMPALHPFFGGVSGDLHTRDFKTKADEDAYILPIKALAMTIVDLLYNNAAEAKKVINDFQPLLKKKEYLSLMDEFAK